MANRIFPHIGIAHIAASVILLMISITGCTRNNGDIGPWFGIWTLNSIEADGTPVPDYEPNTIFWKFQSTVINITQLLECHDYHDTFGTWRQIDDSLLELNFTHSNDGQQPGTGLYAPPEEMHLPSEICKLHIVRFTGKSLVLTYISAEEITYTYTLSK